MSNHTPMVPETAMLDILRAYIVDTKEGKVFKRQGFEVGFPVGPMQYIHICITLEEKRHRNIKRSHIVWWKATGEWPKQMLDHIDRNTQNDRYDNLRYTTSSQNNFNRGEFRKRLSKA